MAEGPVKRERKTAKIHCQRHGRESASRCEREQARNCWKTAKGKVRHSGRGKCIRMKEHVRAEVHK